MTDTTDTNTAETVDPAVTEAAEAVDTEPTGEAAEPNDAEQAQADDAPDERQDREALKYRRRLRDTEAQRDTLAAQVEALQRAAIEAQATAQKIKPAALWASGVELAELIAEDGTVDTGKVTAAITAARDSLGIPAPPSPLRVPREGNNPQPSSRDSMLDVVMGR